MIPGFVLILALLLLAGCEAVPERPPVPAVSKRSLIVSLALREWAYFGRQKVRYDGAVETISPVGAWEDDEPQSTRVQSYWAAVGKPEWTGKDCQEPWSAAFVSWVIRTAGVSEEQFVPSIAHWMYLSDILRHDDVPDRQFVARPLHAYAPRPGDLVCATRGDTRIPVGDTLPEPSALEHAKLHCNIVVDIADQSLIVIGGNVRNSVSRLALALDAEGRLQSTAEHRWFLAVENRLP